MQSRLSDSKTIKFRADLGFNQIISDRTNNRCIQRGRCMNSIHCLGYRIDLYFYEYKLAIEIDELGHNDRNTDYQIKRQREIEKELNCVFIRTNPDAADFNINKLNNQIFKHIIQAKEEKLKNNSTKELLTYVSSIFIPLKPIKYFVNKYFPHCNHEKYTIKNKANKNRKTI